VIAIKELMMKGVNNLALAASGLLALSFTTIAKEPDQPAVAFVQKEVRASKMESVFVGYVYQLPKKINFGLYTHLCRAFVVADADGKIRPSKTCPSQKLVTDAHKARVKVLISLGGWGWDKQSAAIVSKAEAGH
jgi:hypothetical protein